MDTSTIDLGPSASQGSNVEGAGKMRLPFSFPPDHLSRSRASALFRRPSSGRLASTRSRDVSENAADISNKRPSMFVAPLYKPDALQRASPLELQKSRSWLGSKIPLQDMENGKALSCSEKGLISSVKNPSFSPDIDPSPSPVNDGQRLPCTFPVVHDHQTFLAPAVDRHPSQNFSQINDVYEDTTTKSEIVNLSQSISSHPPSNGENKPSSGFRAKDSALALPYGSEPDISTLLMLGATNVQNGRAELAEQRRKIAHLNDQLETVSREKAELASRLETTKISAKKMLEMSSADYDDLLSAFKSLRAQSQKNFAFIDEARVTLSGVKEVKERATEALKAIEPLIDENGVYLRGQETKAVVTEIQAEYSGAQQVIELLRDKLHHLGGELAEAKHRVSELEASQILKGEELGHTAANLLSSSLEMKELTGMIRRREDEVMEVIQRAAQAEGDLLAVNKRIEELVRESKEKNLKLAELSDLKQRNALLESALDDKTSRISALESLHNDTSSQIEKLTHLLRDQEVQLLSAKKIAAIHEENARKLDDSLESAKRLTNEYHTTVCNLRDELSAASVRELLALSKGEEAALKVTTIEGELARTKSALTASEERLQQANTRYEVLHERFEDQSITLRITKDLSVELQERVTSTAVDHAARIESETGKLKLEIAVLHEQKQNLQTALGDLRIKAAEDLQTQRQTFNSSISDLEAKLAHQDTNSTQILQAEQRRANHAEVALEEVKSELIELKCDLDEARNARIALDNKLASLHADLEETTKQSMEHAPPSPSLVAELVSMKERVRELECANGVLVERAINISDRHKNGDLNDEEKVFVNALIRMTQSVHEEQLIAKGNELRRRDNMINTLKNRIGGLESKVARLLQEKAKTDYGNSMIVLKNFMSSSPRETRALLSAGSIADLAPGSTAAQTLTSSSMTDAIPSILPDPSALQIDYRSGLEGPSPTPATAHPEMQRPFGQLGTCEDDNGTDPDDDVPILQSLVSGPAKRDRTASPQPAAQINPERPSRRPRTCARNLHQQLDPDFKPSASTKARGKRQRR